MWKIKLIYNDDSKCTITGKQKEIPKALAVKYHNQYVAGRVMKKSVYQQYPVKDHEEQDLYEYIEMAGEEDDKDDCDYS